MSETANARANYTATAPYPRSVRVGPKSFEVGPKPRVLSLREADLFAIREAGVTLEPVPDNVIVAQDGAVLATAPTTEKAAAGAVAEFPLEAEAADSVLLVDPGGGESESVGVLVTEGGLEVITQAKPKRSAK